ncbi:MAG: hypothetical protein IKL27_05770, partial [Oscillospiraceae bacterium]|nr:hypothetical protein [Oscillospiraceae bacterium]
MYQFRPVSERMKLMRELVRNRVYHIDSENPVIMTRAAKKYESHLPAIKNALIFKAVCEEQTTRVEEHEVLVANLTKFFSGTHIDPRWGGGGFYVANVESGLWKMGEDGLYHNPDTDELRMVISPEDVEGLKSIGDYWKGRTIGEMAQAWQPDGYEELNELGVRSFGANMPIVMM